MIEKDASNSALAERALQKIIADADVRIANSADTLPFGKLHELLLVSGPVPTTFQNTTDCSQSFFVKTVDGKSTVFPFNLDASIAEIKIEMSGRTHIPTSHIVLIHAGKVLEDSNFLKCYSIHPDSTLHMLMRLPGGSLFTLCSDQMAPKWDFDFTHLVHEEQFERGNQPYYRPYGWKRLALDVLDRYPPSNAWLGKPGRHRTHSHPDEWPVSYHGTARNSGISIASEGFDLTKHKRFQYGYGIYSSPKIEVAAKYATSF
ncbi:hypothetical protein HK097_001474 [Rhizophlyctis rosea]|uniref:Ubiquitin-like domain-containing protein n=1 Tax=Rhizophlyctis rosea TaxID=64517 RepID=A0AAD5S6P2_9FUNG|nr:hypothetical protein HK097_001474 [Rhizophlyctis rosea]